MIWERWRDVPSETVFARLLAFSSRYGVGILLLPLALIHRLGLFALGREPSSRPSPELLGPSSFQDSPQQRLGWVNFDWFVLWWRLPVFVEDPVYDLAYPVGAQIDGPAFAADRIIDDGLSDMTPRLHGL